MKTTTLRYELSGDGLGLKKWFRGRNGTESFYHVHSDEMTELEQWIYSLLSRPNPEVTSGSNAPSGEAESLGAEEE